MVKQVYGAGREHVQITLQQNMAFTVLQFYTKGLQKEL